MNTTTKPSPVKSDFISSLMIGLTSAMPMMLIANLFNVNIYSGWQMVWVYAIAGVIGIFISIPINRIVLRKTTKIKVLIIVTEFLLAIVFSVVLAKTHTHITLPFLHK